jgi:cell volume regulation protein A
MAEVFGTITLLTLFGLTVIIGYIGNLIFRKSKIPDVIWLMFFGFLVGPVFSLIDTEAFVKLVPFLSSLALLIILFDSGLHMNIYRVIRDTPRSLALAISGIVVSMLLVGGISMLYFNTDIMTGLILGAILGGTSSPIVLSLVRESETRSKIKNLLSLESALTDALTIIVTLFLLNIVLAITPSPPLIGLLGPFSIGAMLGLVAGLVWLFVLDRLKGLPFSHMLTLSIVFILYAFVEISGGSGPLASLFFGIVIGNGKNFSLMLKLKKVFEVDTKMKMFQDEITFFIRSFFFVLLGLLVFINTQIVLIGIVISVVLILGRIVTTEIGIIKLKIPHIERDFIRVMVPRGLAAAVLAQIVIAAKDKIPEAEVFADIVFIVILATVFYSSAVTMILSRKMDMEEKKKAKGGERKNSLFKSFRKKAAG